MDPRVQIVAIAVTGGLFFLVFELVRGQTLAAALNHSALNIGNATGAWVGGLVIAAGFGYTAPAAAGALLAAAGIAVLTVSVALQRRGRRVLA